MAIKKQKARDQQFRKTFKKKWLEKSVKTTGHNYLRYGKVLKLEDDTVSVLECEGFGITSINTFFFREADWSYDLFIDNVVKVITAEEEKKLAAKVTALFNKKFNLLGLKLQ